MRRLTAEQRFAAMEYGEQFDLFQDVMTRALADWRKKSGQASLKEFLVWTADFGAHWLALYRPRQAAAFLRALADVGVTNSRPRYRAATKRVVRTRAVLRRVLTDPPGTRQSVHKLR